MMQDSSQLGVDSAASLRNLEPEGSLMPTKMVSDPEWAYRRAVFSDMEDIIFRLARGIGQGLGEQHTSPSLAQKPPPYLPQHDGDVESALSEMQIALAPHKLLHTDILAEIFLHCVGETPIYFPPSILCPPWTLGRVCSRWRSVVRSDSRIWSSVSVFYPLNLRAVEAARTMLPSGGLLSIALICGGDPVFESKALHLLIIPHLPRIHRLELSLSCDAFLHLFAMPPNSFSAMQSLTLDIVPSSSPVMDIVERLRVTSVFGSAEQLQKVKVVAGDSRILNTLLSTHIVWDRVTDLKLSAIDLVVAHRILKQCACLVKFSANIKSAGRRAVCDGDCTLSHLQSLTLGLKDTRIFKLLIVPALTSLNISGDVPLGLATTDLSAMIARSGCDLQELQFQGLHKPINYDINALHHFLESVPSLPAFYTSLVFRQSTLEKIASRELLPHLEVLYIGLDCPIAFVNLLKARVRRELQTDSRDGVFREAQGYYVGLPDVNQADMKAAVEQLQALNEEYGTKFDLVMD